MKLSKKIAAVSVALVGAAALTFTGCDDSSIGKDYFFGTWDTGVYKVGTDKNPVSIVEMNKNEADYGTAEETTTYNVLDDEGNITAKSVTSRYAETSAAGVRVVWFFNGKSQSLGSSSGVFYQIRLNYAAGDKAHWDAKIDYKPGTDTFWFGTYDLNGQDSELKTGTFNLSYMYSVKDKNITIDQLIAWAKAQNASSDNGVDALMAKAGTDDSRLKMLSEVWGTTNGYITPSSTTAYYGSNNGIKIQAVYNDVDSYDSDKDAYTAKDWSSYTDADKKLAKIKKLKKVSSEVDVFQFEFGGAAISGYTSLTATYDTEAGSGVTNNWYGSVSKMTTVTDDMWKLVKEDSSVVWSEASGTKGVRSLTMVKKAATYDDSDEE